jgi:hypothetical protein
MHLTTLARLTAPAMHAQSTHDQQSSSLHYHLPELQGVTEGWPLREASRQRKAYANL